MRQAILAGISALIMTVLLPACLLEPVQPEAEQVLLVIEQGRDRPEQEKLRLHTGVAVEEMELETYLVGVVLSEMPASFEPEALKAQAVAARTFALRQMEGGKHADFDLCTDSSCCQAWRSAQSMEQKLGSSFLQYWQKAQDAVAETKGLVLTYNGALIDAVYFSCSGGTTEDAVAVWGSDVPYLQSVSSAGEEAASSYSSTVSIGLAQFRGIVLAENAQADLSGSAETWFGAVQTTRGGGVAAMEIGGVSFSGTRLRTLFGLKSTKFSVVVTAEAVVFQVSGYGHRVGMSQYGANAMAKAGSTFDQILHHYYSGVTLEEMGK